MYPHSISYEVVIFLFVCFLNFVHFFKKWICSELYFFLLSLSLPISLQRGVSVRRGCVMETATVRTTRTKITARRCCVNSRTTCAPITIRSAYLQKSCATARTTVPTAQMRNSAVSTLSLAPAVISPDVLEDSLLPENAAHLSSFHRSCSFCFPAADLCSLENGGCSHNCTIAPGEGILCSCPTGMELGSDNKTCQIQSFCAKHLKCSQRCIQEKATVKCACYEGWALEPDHESCKSTGERDCKSLCANQWKCWVLFENMVKVREI